MGMSQIQNDTNQMMVQSGINFRSSTGGSKFDSKLEGRRCMFTIFYVKVANKVICILRLGKGNSFLSLQYLEVKEIMQVV